MLSCSGSSDERSESSSQIGIGLSSYGSNMRLINIEIEENYSHLMLRTPSACSDRVKTIDERIPKLRGRCQPMSRSKAST